MRQPGRGAIAVEVPSPVLRAPPRPGALHAHPDPSNSLAVKSRTVRTDVPLPDSVTEEELRLHAAEELRDRVGHLERALKAAGQVLQPYLGGNGR